MNRVLVDIGNSRLKYAHATPWPSRPWALPCDAALPRALEAAWREHDVPDALWAASVGSPLARDAVSNAAARLGWPAPRMPVVHRQWGSLRVGYDDINGLGVDRWLAMLGARARTEASFIVIDTGTAVTLDLVDARGQHRGGGIVPGLDAMRGALPGAIQHAASGGTAGPTWPATNTADGIEAATLLGLAELINGLATRLAGALADRPELFLTGGDADRLRAYLASPVVHAPSLVLEGLARVAGYQDAP